MRASIARSPAPLELRPKAALIRRGVAVRVAARDLDGVEPAHVRELRPARQTRHDREARCRGHGGADGDRGQPTVVSPRHYRLPEAGANRGVRTQVFSAAARARLRRVAPRNRKSRREPSIAEYQTSALRFG